MAREPRFHATQAFQAAAPPVPLCFPTSPSPALFVGPRVWLALVLALPASLAHLALVSPR
jgi:hypothetical protein